MRQVRISRTAIRHFGGITAAVLASLPGLSVQAQSGLAAEQKPTVAVMEFDNSAMVRRDEFGALKVGVQVVLAGALGNNPNIVVIERGKIQELLDEGTLGASGRIDPATAVKIGKLLGAQHLVFGAFIVQPDMQMRLTVRSINTETGVLEYSDAVDGRGDKVLKLIDNLAEKINTGLKLPGKRDSKSVKEQGLDGPNQIESILAASAARQLEEKGDVTGAIALYRKAAQLNPEFLEPRVRVALLEKKTP